MTLTHADVTHIAHLARLALSEAELAHYAPKLVYVDANNNIVNQRGHIPVQMAV